jgi:histone chaperone ASF1
MLWPALPPPAQVLDSVLVGPVYAGNYRFVFEGNPPEASRIPADDLVGLAVILLTCSYRGKEFIRIGYYVNNEYADEALKEAPPDPPIIDKLTRNILADHPRVTRFPVEFDSDAGAVPRAGDATAAGDDPMGAAELSSAPSAAPSASGMAADNSPPNQQAQQQSAQRGVGMPAYFPSIGAASHEAMVA